MLGSLARLADEIKRTSTKNKIGKPGRKHRWKRSPGSQGQAQSHEDEIAKTDKDATGDPCKHIAPA